MKVVYIEWLDTIKQLDWEIIKDLNIDINISKSIGWLVKENELSLVIALSYDDDTKSVSCFKNIPKVAIKKRKYIKL